MIGDKMRSLAAGPLTKLVGLGLILSLLSTLGFGFGRDPRTIASPLVDRPAPTFRLSALDGSVADLASLRGRPVVLNFWASWCVPCRDEAPLLRDADARYRGRGVVFLGVIFQDSAEAARAFVERYAIDYPVLIDAGGRVAIDYGVYGIPETFFIDPGGKVRTKQIGPLDAPALEQQIQALFE